jgi:hypothetical protein
MIYEMLQEALDADPKRKGVALFAVSRSLSRAQYIWARSKREALGMWAESEGVTATKYRAGVEVDNDLTPPSLQEEMFDGEQ